MQYPIDGFPSFPLIVRVPTWLLRYTIAPRMLNRILKTRKWPEGIPTDTNSSPADAIESDASGVLELSEAVDRLVNYSGPLKASPLLGMLDKPTLIELHCIHSAHHLGFLIPKPSS